MRENLAKLNDGEYYHFKVTVQKFGIRNKIRNRHMVNPEHIATVCLQDVSVDGVILTDHVWDALAAGLRTAGQLHPGDVLEFDAQVTEYTKGYRGSNPVIQKKCPIRKDYSLTNYTNLQLVNAATTRPAYPTAEDAVIAANRDAMAC